MDIILSLFNWATDIPVSCNTTIDITVTITIINTSIIINYY